MIYNRKRRNRVKKTDKEQLVAELSAQVKEADALFLTNFKGLTFPQITKVRTLLKNREATSE